MAQRPAVRYDEADSRLNEYFIDQDGISREVIQADICRYLGRDALVRPGTHQGRPGYFIRAYRNLTSEMIADLKADSGRWDAEVDRRQERGYPRGTYFDDLNVPSAPNRAPANYDSSSMRQARQPAYPPGGQPQFEHYPPQQGYPPHQGQPVYPPYNNTPPTTTYPPEPSSYAPGPTAYPPTTQQPPVTTAEQQQQSYVYAQGGGYPSYPSGMTQPRYPGQAYEPERDYSPVNQSTSPYPPTSGPDPRMMDPRYAPESGYVDSRQSDRSHPRDPARRPL